MWGFRIRSEINIALPVIYKISTVVDIPHSSGLINRLRISTIVDMRGDKIGLYKISTIVDSLSLAH